MIMPVMQVDSRQTYSGNYNSFVNNNFAMNTKTNKVLRLTLYQYVPFLLLMEIHEQLMVFFIGLHHCNKLCFHQGQFDCFYKRTNTVYVQYFTKALCELVKVNGFLILLNFDSKI